MAKRTSDYLGSQSPPPYPPIPSPMSAPINPSSRDGSTDTISLSTHGSNQYSTGKPCTHSYIYGRRYGVPGLTHCISPTRSLHPTSRSPQVQKNHEVDNSNTMNSNNKRKQNCQQKLETEGIPSLLAHVAQECSSKTSTKTKSKTIPAKSSISWTCETCKVTLESEKAFKNHRKSHVKCPDCSFEAAPKIVKAHFQAEHGKFSGSGFKTITVGSPGCRVQRFKICVGNRPEDIQRWIAERRKRFPRSASKNVSKSNDTKTDSITSERTSISFDSTPKVISSGETQKQKSTVVGLSSLLAGYESSDDDDSENDIEVGKLCDSKSSNNFIPIIRGVQDMRDIQHENNKFISARDTVIERKDKDLSKSPTSKGKRCLSTTSELYPQGKQIKKSRPCRFYFQKGSCRNGYNCRFSHEVEQFPHQSQLQKKNQRQLTISRSNNNTRKRKPGGNSSPRTLLHKLLQIDIERESTLSIQLLKFITDNNFFLDEDNEKNRCAKNA